MFNEELMAMAQKRQEEEQAFSHRISVCVAAGCISAGSLELLNTLKGHVRTKGLHSVQIKPVGCMGPCDNGPVVRVEPQSVIYRGLRPVHIPKYLDALLAGEAIEDSSVHFVPLRPGKPVSPGLSSLVTFLNRQKRIVLENSGIIDPEDLADYLARDGYSALCRVLFELSPNEVIEWVTQSGLRGRGGAGYSTGLKWRTVSKAGGGTKFVVCNADEGDPGAFMDRSVLESDPHRVIEGMCIASYAVGAHEGFVYIRAEYPLAIERLQKAIRQAERAGLLGKGILGSRHDFHLEIRYGAGAYVCGEETALLASIEGKRGQPRPKPPYPAERGLWGASTLINNVETFANIPVIFRKGPEALNTLGTETSKGTKVFALTGRIRNTGLIEVPMGITLREIVFDLGGGVPSNEFKAVQTGGPSGGAIPAQYLDMAVDYESLARTGSIMGSGGMIVMDGNSNMVEVAKFFMDFSVSESCGKCVPCRVGTVHLCNLLNRFLARQASYEDLNRLEWLCDLIKNTSLCGLGQSAPNPVLSALRYFRPEFEALIGG
jgi:bidirectional [NiFe] hydrogenase diaphorase subunit